MKRLACTALVALTILVAILSPTKSSANPLEQGAAVLFECPNTGRAQWVATPYPHSVAGTGKYLSVVGGPGECGYLVFLPVFADGFDSLDFYATSESALKSITFTLVFSDLDLHNPKDVELRLRGGREVDIIDQGTPVFHMKTARHWANVAPWKNFQLHRIFVQFDNPDPRQIAQFGNLTVNCNDSKGNSITLGPGSIVLATINCDDTF